VLRAVHELQACGLLIETRKGARPNKAAWFALSWLDLDHGQGLDIDPKQYRRGDYLRPETVAPGNGNVRTAKATEARKGGSGWSPLRWYLKFFDCCCVDADGGVTKASAYALDCRDATNGSKRSCEASLGDRLQVAAMDGEVT